MVITMLEAHVEPEKWAALEQKYSEVLKEGLTPGLVQTFLLRGTSDPTLWRIATVWSSREALDEMRRSGTTPAGVLIFRAANAEPTLSIFEVRASSLA